MQIRTLIETRVRERGRPQQGTSNNVVYRVRIAVFTLTGLLLMSAPATAKDVITIYSNVCYHEESGDLAGELIILLRQYGVTHVVYQRTGGVMMPPDHVIAAKLEAARIDFQLEGGFRFSGRVSKKEIIGWFSHDPQRVVRLPRQVNVDDGAPTCK